MRFNSKGWVNIDFMICGFSKCGTTTLWTLLKDHPGNMHYTKADWKLEQGMVLPTAQTLADKFRWSTVCGPLPQPVQSQLTGHRR